MASDEDGGDEHREFPMGHSSINEHGGEYLPDEHLAIFGQTTTTLDVFAKPDKTFQRSRSTYKNTGRWVAENATVEETFKDGPICLDMHARDGVSVNQHNYLIDCSTFFKRKYPDNWEEPLQWVNVNVLRPPGNPDKLKEIIRTVRDKQYFPRCQEEPMASRCYSRACRLQKYGVGEGNGGAGQDMALTVIDTYPAIYFVGDDENRMKLTSDELTNLTKYRNKCLDHQRDFPVNVTAKDWLLLIHTLIKDAVKVQPSILHRKNFEQLEALEKYFAIHITWWAHSKGDEFLTGKVGDDVRVRIKDERIFCKWRKVLSWCDRVLKMNKVDLGNMRAFIEAEAMYHAKEDGERDFFRCSHSFRFSMFDENEVHNWLYPPKLDGT